MKKHYILRILLLFSFFNLKILVKAQIINLVPNAGFDSVNCLQQKIYSWDLQGFAIPGSTCFPQGFSPGPNFKAPYINPNPWSFTDTYQPPLNGGGFVGVGVVGSGRGYAVAELKEPLKPYTAYYCRFNVAPHYPNFRGFPWIYTDAIGMAITYREKKIQFGDSYYNEPIAAERKQMLRDTANWTRVNGRFFSRGEERFIAIGNIRTDKETKIDTNKFIPWSGFQNIFYIDDVLVTKFDPLPDSSLLCLNETKILDATFYDNPKYEWNDGSHEPTLKVTKPGRYYVDVFIDDLIFSDTVVVVPEKGYKGLPTDTVVCDRGPAVVLSINVEAKYKWSTGQTSKAISLNTGGRYSVTVTTPQCSLQFSTDVKARNCFCDFYAPTAFSPNGDGENETFKPFINCKVIYVKDYKFQIFNRFGNLIFTTKDINETWDGTYKGQPCSEDVYGWVVEYNTLIDNGLPYRKVVESGDVTLMK